MSKNKQNITNQIRPCRSCGEPTPYFDGYCETCEPPAKVDPHPFQPAYKDYHAPDETQ